MPSPVLQEATTTASIAAAPPPAAERPAEAAAANRVSDADAIQGTLGKYRTAFNGLDARAAGAVWPTVDQRALQRAFERLKRQSLIFENCTVDARAVQATATCRGTAEYVPKVGAQSSRRDSRQWTFSLHKVEEQWLIDAVNSR